ncbi:MAG: hypothetical protein A07HB70_01595 [uncultured archaeon A07HB70]|nr:MAG: hypothetical protein A07HB70_01595 [uncultured archaeon A07HB70]
MSGDAAGSRATFDAVVDGVAAWQPDEAATRGLCEHLDRRLNEGVENVWEREVVEREPGSSEAEVVVNGEIAVVFAEAVGPATVSRLRRSLSALARRYSYLVVYWRDPEREDRGYRWSVERSISARRVGTRGLTFVAPPDEAPSVAEGSRMLSWSTVAAGATLLCAVSASLWLVVGTTGLVQALAAGAAGLFVWTLLVGPFVAR